jgi:hypothetical protein
LFLHVVEGLRTTAINETKYWPSQQVLSCSVNILDSNVKQSKLKRSEVTEANVVTVAWKGEGELNSVVGRVRSYVGQTRKRYCRETVTVFPSFSNKKN